MPSLKIGVDLDHTVYGFPAFFREFIPAMVAAGHKVYCTSNHTKTTWHEKDRDKLRGLGIDPDLIDPSLMPDEPVVGDRIERRQAHKSPVADQLDIVFDDHAGFIQPHTRTPIFCCPGKWADDWKKRGW